MLTNKPDRRETIVIASSRYHVVAKQNHGKRWGAKSKCPIEGCDSESDGLAAWECPSADIALAICVARVRRHYNEAHLLTASASRAPVL
jgi:hypothetical protein